MGFDGPYRFRERGRVFSVARPFADTAVLGGVEASCWLHCGELRPVLLEGSTMWFEEGRNVYPPFPLA